MLPHQILELNIKDFVLDLSIADVTLEAEKIEKKKAEFVRDHYTIPSKSHKR